MRDLHIATLGPGGRCDEWTLLLAKDMFSFGVDEKDLEDRYQLHVRLHAPNPHV